MYMYNCGICTLSLWACISMATTGGCQGDSGDVFQCFSLGNEKIYNNDMYIYTPSLPPSPIQTDVCTWSNRGKARYIDTNITSTSRPHPSNYNGHQFKVSRILFLRS